VEDLPEEENIKKDRRKRFKSEGDHDKGDPGDGDEESDNRKKRKFKDSMKGGKFSMATRLKLAKQQQEKAGSSSFSPSKYKSAKSSGDVKKKGSKFEPFAYVPLDPRQLNKRRRLHAHTKYKAVMTRRRTIVGKNPVRGISKPRTQRKAIKKHKLMQ